MLATEAAKDSSPIFSNLQIFRKSLSLPDVHENKTNNSYIDDL
jgi:hypothetical protein